MFLPCVEFQLFDLVTHIFCGERTPAELPMPTGCGGA